MKVFVSTLKTQGQRANDFCFVPAGEKVKPSGVCARDQRTADGGCGCNRSMTGLVVSKATTTLEVVESETTPESLYDELLTSRRREGWLRGDPSEDDVRDLKRDAQWLLESAARYAVGTVLEFRRGRLAVREVAS